MATAIARVVPAAALAVALIMAVVPTHARGAQIAATDPTASSRAACPDWGMYGRIPARTFNQECPTSLSPFTASSLTPIWAMPTLSTVTASPAVVEEVVYVGDWSGTMYAIDADSGAQLWAASTEASPGAPFGPIVSSAAIADVNVPARGLVRLVIFGAGPRMYALDASDGSEVWVKYFGANVPGEQTEFESSPVVHEGVIYVGMDVHNRPLDETGGVRGGVFALDAATGETFWYFNPELDNVESGCSSVWSSPTLDIDRGWLFFGTGNCPHDDYPWTPHTEAVTVLEMDTGEVVYTYNPHEPNRLDIDFGATGNLFTLPTGRDVYGIGNKDAIYYLIDVETGEEIWQTQVADPGNFGDDFAVGGFIGSTAVFEANIFGGTAIGGVPFFHALDGDNGAISWTGNAGPTYAAAATAGNVVIHGALDNELKAWHTDTGLQLWGFGALGPISSGPAIVGDRVFVGSGTSSSDLCAKDEPGSEVCFLAFEGVLGATGGVLAFEVQSVGNMSATERGLPGGILLGGEADNLRAYDVDTLENQIVSWNATRNPETGRNINAEICGFDDGSGWFIAGEDTGQISGENIEGGQGWGIFELEGPEVGALTATQIGKLVPTFQPHTTSNPENYGCGFLSDGRVLTSDVGDQFPATPANGQLIVWFAPFDDYEVEYCKIDVAVPTAGGIYVEEGDVVFLASNRPSDDASAVGGIYRYAGDWPTGPSAADGCGRTDGTDAPLVDDGAIEKTLFIGTDDHATTPSAIWPSGNDTYYVTSVFNGVIAEYDKTGAFVREILRPPGAPNPTTGTPFGITVGPDGTIYYADLGILIAQPAPWAGTVRRIRFDASGNPLPPETLKSGLQFPDGVGFVQPAKAPQPPAPPAPPPAVEADQAPLPTTGGGIAVLAVALFVAAGLSRSKKRPSAR